MQANEETARELIPKKVKTKQMNIANLCEYSESVKKYFENPNDANRTTMQEDKKKLQVSHNNVTDMLEKDDYFQT